MESASLDGGFADHPVEAARAFRAALEVLARPGRIERVSGARPPAPLPVSAGVLLLTLADAATPVHLAGACDTAEVRGWLAFHTGAPVAGPDACAFAVGRWEDLLPLSAYPAGNPEYPDRGATLIVLADRLEAEGARLTGPGIKDAAHLSLPAVEPFRENAARFPLGLDFFFCCGDRLAGLPRSTRVDANQVEAG